MELLLPTLNKGISYQFLLALLEGANHKQSSQNNQSSHLPEVPISASLSSIAN